MLSAKRIPPGESGQIEVTVITQESGALSKYVTVTTNDPRQPRLNLTVTAVVRPEFDLSERSIWFGSGPGGKEIVKEILITLPLDKPARIESVTTNDQNVTVRLEPVADSGGKKVKLIAVQKADAKSGYHFGVITVKTTSATTPELKIPVRGQINAGPGN